MTEGDTRPSQGLGAGDTVDEGSQPIPRVPVSFCHSLGTPRLEDEDFQVSAALAALQTSVTPEPSVTSLVAARLRTHEDLISLSLSQFLSQLKCQWLSIFGRY